MTTKDDTERKSLQNSKEILGAADIGQQQKSSTVKEDAQGTKDPKVPDLGYSRLALYVSNDVDR